MSETMQRGETSTTYPGHSKAFEHLMNLAQAGLDAQSAVRIEDTSMALLAGLRNDELPVVFRVGWDHTSAPGSEIARRTVTVEADRRVLAAMAQNIEAVHALSDDIQDLEGVMKSTSATTVGAVDRLDDSVKALDSTTKTWSERLTYFTGAILIFAAAQFALALAVAFHH